MVETHDITKLSIQELKALGFDCMQRLEIEKANLETIIRELNLKIKEQQSENFNQSYNPVETFE